MERVYENKKTNKKKPPVFILVLLIFIVVVLYFIYKLVLYFEPVSTIEYKGYAVTGTELIENLLRTDLNGKQYINPLEIKEDSVIYKKVATYYVGEDKKTKINMDYPIYINNNLALLNMNEDNKLITTDFEEVDSYKNSALTSGALYNLPNLERADYNDYLFLKNSDNVFINEKPIKVVTTSNTYTIPINSIINFRENFISYYHMVNNAFKYEAIVDVSLESKIELEKEQFIKDLKEDKMNSKTEIINYSYKDFLLSLKIIREKKNVKKDEVNEIETDKTEEDDESNTEVKDETSKSNEETSKNTEEGDNKIKWQKPSVTATDFVADVYTANTTISINDPSNTIKEAIVFEIYKNGKIYMRNQTLSSGNYRIGVLEPNTEYEIKGVYRYNTEDNKTVKVQFIDKKIKTKSVSESTLVKLSYEIQNIYSNKIEITNLKIENLVEASETLIGIKSGEIFINGNSYNITSENLRRLINGQTITWTSEENLESNSNMNFEIKLYDISNNLVKLNGNTGKTKTCKKNPTVEINQKNSNTTTNIEFNLIYDNPDNVEIKNKKYKVYSVSNEVVLEGNINSNKIVLNGLDFAKYYTINIYGDYDLDDNKPERIEEVIGTLGFATSRIEDYGDLYIDLSIPSDNISQNSANIKFNINATTNKTNKELIQMIKDVKVYILNENDVKLERNLTQEELSNLKNLAQLSLNLDNLESNKNYTVSLEAIARAGNTEKSLKIIINGNKEFSTLKDEAIINIKNLFILNNMIDFDINIYDKDGAIRDEEVTLEIISTRDEILQREQIKVSNLADEYTRIQIQNLFANEKYYISLIANRYSIKHEESTIKEKAFKFSGDEKRIVNAQRRGKAVGEIKTNNIGGTLTLESLQKKGIDILGNLIDVKSNVNWFSECFNTNKGYLKEYSEDKGILTLGVGNSTSQIYVYDLLSNYSEEDLEEAYSTYNITKLKMSFKYKRSNENLNIYVQKGKDFENKILKIEEDNEDYVQIEDDGWYSFNYEIPVNELDDRYIGLQLSGNENSYIEIKELQLKLDTNSDDVNEYSDYKYNYQSNFKLDLNLYNEKLQEIGYEPNVTNGIYYIKIKNKTDKTEEEIEYTEYVREASNDKGENEKSIEKLLKQLDLVEDKEYEIKLVLKNPNIEEREYVLNTIYVDTTRKEIKNISNKAEYLEIQPNGNYIFSKDIDLGAGDYKFGNSNIYFNGTLDFNGKTISREIQRKEDENYKYYLFYGFSEDAIIENLNFDFSINLTTEAGLTNVGISEKNSGLVYENNGTIRNIIVNLKKGTSSPIREFAIIGYENKGTLENFVIVLRSNFYLGGEGALGFVNCTNGIIKNGYITPFPYTNYAIKPINCGDHTEINISALASHVLGSDISSVYSLVNINNEDENSNNTGKFYAGNLISETKNSNIKNVYSVGIGNITKDNSVNETVGPTISYPYNPEDANNIQNSYFFTDEYSNNNEYNTRINIAALSNMEFQENLLNFEGSEKKFIINNSIRNYFPKIEMPDVMPNQLNIPMKQTLETDADIMVIKPIEDGDLEKLVEITVYNPRESKIDKIEIEGLEIDKYRIHNDKYCNPESPFEKCSGNHDEEGYCLDKNGERILVSEEGYTQNYESGQTTKIITKIRIPKEERLDINGFDSKYYLSKYYLKTIKAKGYAEKVYIEDDGTQRIVNELNLSYYYQIKNTEDWKRINHYQDQNYRVIANLDFANKQMKDYQITYSFSGTLTGKYKDEGGRQVIATLSNVGGEGTEIKENLFYKLDKANVSNLKINGYYQRLDNKNITQDMYMGGLIGVTTKGTVIDDIHMTNVKISTNAVNNNSDIFYIGGLVSNSDETIIRNCSVSYVDDGNYNISDINECKLSRVRIGGLIGYQKEGIVNNCFVRNLYIKINVNTSNGIGGLVGYLTSGEIYGCYAMGQIKTNAFNVGGIFGNGTYIIKYEKHIPNFCQNCYSMVNIKTDGTSIGGIGGILESGSKENVIKNISLGNLYTSVSGSNTNLSRIIGSGSSEEYENYAYEDQLINGFKVTSSDENYQRGAKYVVNKGDLLDNYNNMFNSEYYNVLDLRRRIYTKT